MAPQTNADVPFRSLSRLTPDEVASGSFSSFDRAWDGNDDEGGPFAIIAPKQHGVRMRQALPTILAIPGGNQLCVSKFYLSLRAEQRGWQVIVPLRNSENSSTFNDECGIERVMRLMSNLRKDTTGVVSPYAVEGGVFHLIGNSVGSMTAVAVAVRDPERVASLTLLAGVTYPAMIDVPSLRSVSKIRLYVGEVDELGHREEMESFKQLLDEDGIAAEMTVLLGVGHRNLGPEIESTKFWSGLEASRPRRAFEETKKGLKKAASCERQHACCVVC